MTEEERARVRATKVRLGQVRVAFRGLADGAIFRFSSEEDDPGWAGARGPWVKVGKQRYIHQRDRWTGEWDTYRVGSVNVECVQVFEDDGVGAEEGDGR